MEFKEEKKEIELEKAIVNAIAFFDMFDFPLTSMEIWKYAKVSRKAGPMEIIKILESGNLNNIVEHKNGFYFLQGRREIIESRLKRYIFTGRKFRRVLWVAKIFRFIPWIKMIAVSNVIGAHNLKDESDIDLFIITKAKRVWVTRFFCNSLMQVLGLRPKKGDVRDKICLNFYVSEEALDLRKLMLNDNDAYFIYWLASLIPVYEVDNMYKRFIQANSWIREYLPNWWPVQMIKRLYSTRDLSRFYKNIINLMLGGFELQFKKLQLKLMPESLKGLVNKDTRVVINDQVLKLHVNDRRIEYRNIYIKKLGEIMNKIR
jgi:predicted nucleotidyltransferase